MMIELLSEGWTEQLYEGSLSSLRVMMCMKLYDDNNSTISANDVMTDFITNVDSILSVFSSSKHNNTKINNNNSVTSELTSPPRSLRQTYAAEVE